MTGLAVKAMIGRSVINFSALGSCPFTIWGTKNEPRHPLCADCACRVRDRAVSEDGNDLRSCEPSPVPFQQPASALGRYERYSAFRPQEAATCPVTSGLLHIFSLGPAKLVWLEPISKSLEEDNKAGELDKSEKALAVVGSAVNRGRISTVQKVRMMAAKSV